MKKVLLFLLVFTALNEVYAQTDSIPPGFTGVYEIVLGAKKSSIKKLLEDKPVYDHYTQVQIDAAGQTTPDEEEWGEKTTWLVKKTETKYFTYMGAAVERIEVTFDESELVSHVRLLFKSTNDIESKISHGSIDKFGASPCAMGEDDSYFCSWWKGKYQYTIGNTDALAPEPIDRSKETFFYVDFTYQ